MKIDQARVSDAIQSSIGLLKALSSDDVAKVAAEELKYVLSATEILREKLAALVEACSGEVEEVFQGEIGRELQAAKDVLAQPSEGDVDD